MNKKIILFFLKHIAACLKQGSSKRGEMIHVLIVKGADLFEKLPPLQKTAFHLAAERSHLDVVEILLNGLKFTKKAELAVNNSKKHLKTQTHSINSLSESMQNETSSFIDANGESPLHAASRENNFDICERFIMYGFDLNVKSNLGKHPHDLCTNEGLKKYLFGRTHNCIFSYLFA